MVGWHHQCNGHELEQTLGDGEGQGGLACSSPWSRKESDMNGRLNNIQHQVSVLKFIEGSLILDNQFPGAHSL